MDFRIRVPMFPFSCFLFLFMSGIATCHGVLEGKPCGFLYTESNFTGPTFDIKDDSSFANLEETYLSSDQTWNVTNSFKVQEGCLMTACNESFFDGQCREFTENHSLLPEGFESVMSANCTCAANCLCTDVHMRKTSCARGYISKGCNTCNAFYTDFKGSKDYFPADFKSKIVSIIVRKGCTLTLYDEEEFQEESETLEGVIKETWDGSIGSYECNCNEEETSKEKGPERQPPPNSPPFIDIPSNADNISALLDTELGNIPNIGKHPGLVAALRSIKGKRSPRNAYILLIGLTGAGKSSAINLLFDNPHVTRVGADKSETSAIHEFRIPIPIDYLGIRNSELRVIDTPGLGDTKGLEQDAKFLATLEDYLNGHEELSKRIPNIVLVFGKFHDNRFAGDGANFVKMLRGVDSFRERITDKKFSNVIFVFSHFMSETKAIRRRPGTRLQSFKKVIEDYSLFPKPISIVVAENKAAEQELQMLNGYYKLPNGDFYPRNLFEKIEFATVNGNDPIGEAVIRTAFSDADDFNITSSTHNLVGSQHNKVIKYLSELSGAHFNPENTEVSQVLAAAYETLDMNLRKKFPDALPYLQRSFNIRNILTKADIPKTTFEIVKFMKDIKQNDAVLYLMDKAFGLKAPILKENVITGYGYNVMEDRPLASSPFKLGELRNTDIGYMIPNVITCNVELSSNGIFNLFPNREEYLKNRLQRLNVEGAIPIESFKGEIQPGSNILAESTESETQTQISAVKEHRTFELVLNDRLDLTTQFVNTVKNLTAYNASDYDSVESWKTFFGEYGTHVVKSTHGGGSIEIKLTSNKTFGPEIAQAMFNIIEFAEDVTIGRISNTSFEVDGTNHHLKFRGGDHKYHATDLKSMSLTAAAELLENWKESLILNPAILVTDMRLLPISEVAKKVGQTYATEIQKAAIALFNSTLKYQAPRRSSQPPPDREQTGGNHQNTQNDFVLLFKEMAEQARRSDEKFKEMMMHMQENTNKQMEEREKRRQEDLQWQREQQAALEKQRREDREMDKARLEASEKRFAAELARRSDEAKAEAKRLQLEQRNHQLEMEKEREKAQEREDELRDKLIEANKGGGGCLKKGTRILVPNGLERSVETLRVGDTILDGNLEATEVLGVTAWYLMQQNFYGFEDDFFFTDSHLLVGKDNVTRETRFYTVSPQKLYDINPLMEYLPINDMKREFNILKYSKDRKKIIPEKVSVRKESVEYPVETLVYFIQVSNPEGTYIANGYVCRHESPEFEYWPKTMGLIYSMIYSPEAQAIAQLNYTMASLVIVDQIIDDIYYKMEGVLRKADYVLEDEEDKEILLEQFEGRNLIGDVFGSNPTFTTFAAQLYARTGNALADRLDLDLTYYGKVGTLQKLLWEAAMGEIRRHINSSEFKRVLGI